MAELWHQVCVVWNDGMIVSSIAGYVVLCYSVIDGVFMIWDRVVHKVPFLN